MLEFDAQCKAAIARARCATPSGGVLDTITMTLALVHNTDLGLRFPELAAHLPPLAPLDDGPAAASPDLRTPMDHELRLTVKSLPGPPALISPDMFLQALLSREVTRQWLVTFGTPGALIEAVRGALPPPQPALRVQTKKVPAGSGRGSPARLRALEELSPFGRVLTAKGLPDRGMQQREGAMQQLVRALLKRKRKNALVVGPPGCGKSALVYELARRLADGDGSLPPGLFDLDIFELSTLFMRSGASVVGQYEERVKRLLGILKAHTGIVVFIDEIHSFFQSGSAHRGPFTDANEAFKAALADGDITVIGCTTTAEYRHYIEPDGALARRFGLVTLRAPTPSETRAILRAKLPRMQAHYGVVVPTGLVDRAVDLTEEYLPSRYQPDKAIQLLDDACTYALTQIPPSPEVTEADLIEALEDRIGHELVRPGDFDEERVFAALTRRLKGQDEVLRPLARAFVAGLGDWGKKDKPRGVFLFAGPTGVGKTQAARELARLLGGGQVENLVRVDCNTLQGNEHDSSPAITRLLGVPKGYIGYEAGKGGILSRLRDHPTAVVLFDELEKAPPGVGKLLLQILDDARVEDTEGHMLDFRRAFIVFTTNAGVSYEAAWKRAVAGFGQPSQPRLGDVTVQVDLESVHEALGKHGFGKEFLARIDQGFVFRALDAEATRSIVHSLLVRLQEQAAERGYALSWSDDLEAHLTGQWQQVFGVRHLTAILENRVIEQLAVANASGELEGVQRIELRRLALNGPLQGPMTAGLAMRRRCDEQADLLIIGLA
jgi:ATP-dependent Clp protease ATP-binding subunit ClpA